MIETCSDAERRVVMESCQECACEEDGFVQGVDQIQSRPGHGSIGAMYLPNGPVADETAQYTASTHRVEYLCTVLGVWRGLLDMPVANKSGEGQPESSRSGRAVRIFRVPASGTITSQTWGLYCTMQPISSRMRRVPRCFVWLCVRVPWLLTTVHNQQATVVVAPGPRLRVHLAAVLPLSQ